MIADIVGFFGKSFSPLAHPMQYQIVKAIEVEKQSSNRRYNMKPRTEEKNRYATGIDSQSALEFQEGVMQVAMGIIVLAAALVGVWGVISLFGGLQAGGVAGMAKGWMTAIGVM